MTFLPYIRHLFSCVVVYSVASVLFPRCVEATEYELFYRPASEEPRNLTSQNYPSAYPSNVSSAWWIYSNYMYSSIHLQILFLDIENSSNCENDNLAIYQYFGFYLERVVQVCGNSTTHEKLELGTDVVVTLRSNNETEGSGFVIQYYLVEEDDSEEGDDHRSKRYSNSWGTAVIITFAIIVVVLIAAVAVACYCQRKQKNNNVQEVQFADVAVVAGQEKPSV